MRARQAVLVIALAMVPPGPALAQSIGAAGYVSFGTARFASADTFEIVTGSSSKTGVGVGATVSRVWGGVFVDVALWNHKLDGERVFVDRGTTYPLGIPLTVTLRPVDVVGGWKFDTPNLQPYIGGGITSISYEEKSDFAIDTDNVSDRKTGGVVLVGVDVPITTLFRVGGELRYRSVTGVLGEGGVSQALGEDKLGGFLFAVRASVGR